MNKEFEGLGFYPADIMLPENTDMTKWSVVACDQFTSQPEYWENAKKLVGDAPSTLKMILPEYKIGMEDEDENIRKTNEAMLSYDKQGLFKTYTDSVFYVERVQSDGCIRHGIIGMADLEAYEFTPGNNALIRATEGTVLSRIPPRVKIREKASLELPHIMLLIDDTERTVIEPLSHKTSEMEKLYDFDLMLGGGHIKGYKISENQKTDVALALRKLLEKCPMFFAVGDGNHSLATAKKCYENAKEKVPESEWKNLSERYALVEVVNNHDDALKFEPIHRVLFGADPDEVLEALKKYYPNVKIVCGGMVADEHTQVIDFVSEKKWGQIVIENPAKQLAVGTLQEFLDAYLKENTATIDYIHGDDVVKELGRKPGNIGFLLPAMGKEMLFKTVMYDGILPRKTFSMGHACDKRYYLECRKK